MPTAHATPPLATVPTRRPVVRRPKATTGLASLTKQQRQVAQLVAEDRTNQEIARLLSISDQTVKNHITGIVKKLGVGSRVGVAVTWVRAETLASMFIRQKR